MNGENKGSLFQNFRADKSNGSWSNRRRHHGDNGTLLRLKELGVNGLREMEQEFQIGEKKMIGGGKSMLWKQR